MTRSGRCAAARAATRAKGQPFGWLQSWAVMPLTRQPVSPITTIRRGVPPGRTTGWSIMPMLWAVGGAGSAQMAGKSVPCAARMVMVAGLPSIWAVGQ